MLLCVPVDLLETDPKTVLKSQHGAGNHEKKTAMLIGCWKFYINKSIIMHVYRRINMINSISWLPFLGTLKWLQMQ